MLVELKLPIVLRFSDYHFIDAFAEQINMLLLDEKVEFQELEHGYPNSDYYGLFYIRQEPNKETIEDLLADAEFVE
jgi:hypothetical protein